MRTSDGGDLKVVDNWGQEVMKQHSPREWTGSTRFRKAWRILYDQPGAPVDAVGILDFLLTSHHAKRWNLNDPKDQREGMCLIREQRPRLVLGSCRNAGRVMQERTPCWESVEGHAICFAVLYHEQLSRGVWFLHDLSGYASQLSRA